MEGDSDADSEGASDADSEGASDADAEGASEDGDSEGDSEGVPKSSFGMKPTELPWLFSGSAARLSQSAWRLHVTVIQDGLRTVAVGVLGSGRAACDLIEQGGSGASVGGVVSVLR